MDSLATLLLLGLVVSRVQSTAVLPDIPFLGEKVKDMEYVFWAGSAR